MSKPSSPARAAAAALCLALVAWTAAGPARANDFEAFHGKEGVARIVNTLAGLVTTDPRTKRYFAHADAARLVHELNDQICAAVGGPCAYTGHSMKEAHAGLGIDNAAFNALVEDLQIAMGKEGVPFRAQNRLVAKLAPMQHDIVTR